MPFKVFISGLVKKLMSDPAEHDFAAGFMIAVGQPQQEGGNRAL